MPPHMPDAQDLRRSSPLSETTSGDTVPSRFPGSWSRRFTTLNSATTPRRVAESAGKATSTPTSVSARLRSVAGLSAHRDVEAPRNARHFTIVEEGAEDGQLALDILLAIKEESIEAAACIRYTIVEPISSKQLQQRARLEPHFSKRLHG